MAEKNIKLESMPPTGMKFVNAAQIAWQQVNEKGGVSGRPLELVIEDSASEPERAVSAAEKLVNKHRCSALIGNLLSKSIGGDKLKLLFSLFLVTVLAACSQNESSKTGEIHKIAVLPDQSETLLRSKYQPLVDHISSHTGLNYELLIPESYDQLLQWFDEKKIDMAMFGGVTYVKARLRSKALPLVMRDVDGRFRSVVLVSANNPANSLEAVKGASLAFGSRLSTSGHIMPRFFFRLENIIPENYFSKLQYSGAHDITAEWVRDGKVDVGVANSGIVNEMFLDGRLNQDMVKVIWESPPFADYVWAVQENTSNKHKILVRDAFLHMNQDGEDKQLLKNLGANYYIPAGNDDFSDLVQAVLQTEQQGG